MTADTLEWRRFFVGLDLGKARDYTAVAVVEQASYQVGERSPVDYRRRTVVRHAVRMLERMPLGTAYPDVARRVGRIVRGVRAEGWCALVVDATGVGAPVVDLLRRGGLGCGMTAVTITGGERKTAAAGGWRVPKKDLVAGLAVMLEEGRLRVARRMRWAEEFEEELKNMRVKVTGRGREQYGAWGEGQHDDLVMAVALACWKSGGERGIGMGNRRVV
ncbi:MAG: hypothetical protein IANPNBLG_04783 [Bryobacteraceae bacterium]|nr:hypothetical protein [Bryobacteraceae bacterium]